jgi:hypothetical protein
MIVVTASTIRQILHQGRLLTLLNQREIGARGGLIVSGPAATGKTTANLQEATADKATRWPAGWTPEKAKDRRVRYSD